MTAWRIDVDRVIVRGANLTGIARADLRALVETAVAEAVRTANVPAGRSARASVDVTVPALRTNADVAKAVALGVTKAVGERANG